MQETIKLHFVENGLSNFALYNYVSTLLLYLTDLKKIRVALKECSGKAIA